MANSISSLKNIPDIITRRYTIRKEFNTGGSTAKTFLVVGKDKKLRILKYATWEGIGYNGIPWLKSQAEKLIELRDVISDTNICGLPVIYERYERSDLYYYTLEYFDNAVPLSQYYLKKNGDIIHSFLSDIDTLISFLSTSFYAKGHVNTPEEYISNAYLKRVDYRLNILTRERGEMYNRYFKGRAFSIDGHVFKNITYYFRELIAQNKITINSQKYLNPLTLLLSIEKNTEILHKLKPAFLPIFEHGDSLFRNYLRLPDNSFRIIDVRGENLPKNFPSKICIPFELGKMLHSIGADIIRSNNFILHFSKNGKFKFTYNLKNKNISDFIKVRNEMPNIFLQNKDLKAILRDENNLMEKTLFAEACHYLADSPNRLEQDTSGLQTIAFYLTGTMLLNNYLRIYHAELFKSLQSISNTQVQ